MRRSYLSRGVYRLNKRLAIIIGVSIAGVSSLGYLGLDSQPNMTGRSYAEQFMVECEGNVDCIVVALTDLSKREKQNVVLLTFDELISMYHETSNYCHPPAHHLAHFLYTYIGNLTEAFSYADERCGGAVYHGLVESYFVSISSGGGEHQHNNRENLTIDPDDIDVTKICQSLGNLYSLGRYECSHGIGHGLAISYNYDVFAAVARCEELVHNLEQISCFNGFFMANVDEYKKSGDGAFDKNDPLFPCNAVDAKAIPACYNYHVSYMLRQNNLSLAEGFSECNKIVPEEFVKFCYRGIGRQVSVSAFSNLERSLTVCQIGKPQYHSYCLGAVVIGLAKHKGVDQTFQLCKLSPEQLKMYCYDRIGKWILLSHSSVEEREKECSNAETPQYFEVCMNASLEDLDLL